MITHHKKCLINTLQNICVAIKSKMTIVVILSFFLRSKLIITHIYHTFFICKVSRNINVYEFTQLGFYTIAQSPYKTYCVNSTKAWLLTRAENHLKTSLLIWDSIPTLFIFTRNPVNTGRLRRL